MGIIIAVLMIAYAGFLWVTNPINAENRTKARSVLMNAGIGLLIALGAWLIVNTLLGALSGGTSNIGTFTGFLSGGSDCIQANNQTPGPSGGGLGGSGNNGCPGNLVCSSSGACASDPQLDNGDGSAGAHSLKRQLELARPAGALEDHVESGQWCCAEGGWSLFGCRH